MAFAKSPTKRTRSSGVAEARQIEGSFSSTRSAGLPFEVKDLASIIRESVNLVESKLKKAQVKIELELLDGVNINCNEVEIEQVFVNLLNNSIDEVQSLPDRWIKIKLQKLSHEVLVQVIDSGPGISDKLRDRIFEP